MCGIAILPHSEIEGSRGRKAVASMYHRPSEVSGRERQEVTSPCCPNDHCILADEPTGNLGGKTGARL